MDQNARLVAAQLTAAVFAAAAPAHAKKAIQERQEHVVEVYNDILTGLLEGAQPPQGEPKSEEPENGGKAPPAGRSR